MNVTVPLGLPEVAETVALNDTACPAITGFCDEFTAVVVVSAVGVVWVVVVWCDPSLPPQPTSVIDTAMIASNSAVQRLRFLKLLPNTIPKTPMPLMVASNQDEPCCGLMPAGTSAEALTAVVVTVSCTLTGVCPSIVIDAGENVHVVYAGSVPQLSVTTPL